MAVAPDFSRSSLTWKTRSGYSGSWWLVAIATKLGTDDRILEEYGLAPMVMAGNASGDGPLGKSPAYSYQILASSSRHVIFRSFGVDGRSDDSEDGNAALFKHLAIGVRQVSAEETAR